MPQLIYLHGFASGRQSSTANKLLEVFTNVVIAEYDTLDPRKGEAQLAGLIESHLPVGEVILRSCAESLQSARRWLFDAPYPWAIFSSVSCTSTCARCTLSASA